MSTRPWIALIALVAVAPTARAQATKTGDAPKAAAAAAPRPGIEATPVATMANAKQVVGTVDGEPITRGEVVNMLGRMQIPFGREEEAYLSAVDILVNIHLLSRFLNDQKIAVSPKDIDAELNQQRKIFADQKTSLENVLSASGTTLDEAKTKIVRGLQWKQYIAARISDPELTRYMKQHVDLFSGNRVRASHILIKVDPKAPAADKDAAKAKLAGIRAEIKAGKISFPDAANKYSEDLQGETPNGGDVGYFGRRGELVEPFVAAAFALPKGEISEPVETEYGYHLIQVTDRQNGKMPELAQVKDQIVQVYGADAQDTIIKAARDKAKVDVKPMPADLFPKPKPQPAAAKGAEAPKAN